MYSLKLSKMLKKVLGEKMFTLECIDCGYRWKSSSGDWGYCPMCDGKDIVIICR